MLAHAPEVAVEEVVEARQTARQRRLVTVGRVARLADDQVPATVRVQPDQLRWRRADAVLPVDAAALDAAADVERALERAHAQHALVRLPAPGAALEHVLPVVGLARPRRCCARPGSRQD